MKHPQVSIHFMVQLPHNATGAEGVVQIESEWTARRREAKRGLAGEQLRIPSLR
jgi:hypothetical protein